MYEIAQAKQDVLVGVNDDRFVFGVPQAGAPYAGSIFTLEVILVD